MQSGHMQRRPALSDVGGEVWRGGVSSTGSRYNTNMETTAEHIRGGWKLDTPGKPTRGLVLTARDVSILHDLYLGRFMHAGHFKALYGGEKAGRRLLELA